MSLWADNEKTWSSKWRETTLSGITKYQNGSIDQFLLSLIHHASPFRCSLNIGSSSRVLLLDSLYPVSLSSYNGIVSLAM
jgi:hypothetical protein